MRKTHYALSSIALLLAVNLLIGPQFINTVSGTAAEEEQDFDDGVVEDLQVSEKLLKKSAGRNNLRLIK